MKKQKLFLLVLLLGLMALTTACGGPAPTVDTAALDAAEAAAADAEVKLKEAQDALEAARQAREKEKELLPVATVYIPINYADANADILPHLQNIVTPDRGVVSVHSATNQIILKDTEEKIAECTLTTPRSGVTMFCRWGRMTALASARKRKKRSLNASIVRKNPTRMVKLKVLVWG